MNQKQLVDLLRDRGWRITRSLSDLTAGQKETRGISIHALSPTGYILSIQAGEGLTSAPRYWAEDYELVELAIWKDHSHGGAGQFINPDGTFNRGASPIGYATLPDIINAAKNIEAWTEGNEPYPVSTVHRKNAPHRDLN